MPISKIYNIHQFFFELSIKELLILLHMKKTIYFLLLTAFSSNAQITKNNWLVGGDASFTFSQTEVKKISSGTNTNYDSKGTYSIRIDPNLGYFILNKFAVGCKVSYLNSFSEGSKLNSDDMNLSVGPYLKYYLLKDESIFNVFIETSFSKFLSKSLGNAATYGLKSGFVIFLNSSVGLESVISYNKTSTDKIINDNVFIGFGLQIHLEKE